MCHVGLDVINTSCSDASCWCTRYITDPSRYIWGLVRGGEKKREETIRPSCYLKEKVTGTPYHRSVKEGK